MTSNVSNRHRGNLGGRFTDERIPSKVTISATSEVAASPTAQHLIWMLVNLLARQTHEICRIEFDIPFGVKPVERISPLVPKSSDFVDVLRVGIEQINQAVLAPEAVTRARVSVRVGPGIPLDSDFALVTTALAWSGYVGQSPTTIMGSDSNTIGAYIAASLCAAEVFKFARGMRPDAGTLAQDLWLDAYNFRVSQQVTATPALPHTLNIQPTVVVGIGAVANGFLHTLYPLAGLHGDLTLIDNDDEGVTDTNLNRYVLFGLPHVEGRHLKASTAAAMFEGRDLMAHAVDASWQQWRSEQPDFPLGLVISAVDKNSARHSVQDALPKLILGASTKDMRAQVNLYDVFGGGQCLRCRNPVEPQAADDVVIGMLHNLTPEQRAIEAMRVGVSVEDLESFIDNPIANCGRISGATLQKFAGTIAGQEWSVGFASLLAGVLLAAEYLKMSGDSLQTTLNAQRDTFRFQFWRPASDRANAVVETPAEERCICQSNAFQRAAAILHST